MITCPNCRAQYLNGTLFCDECGTDLQTPAASTFGLEVSATASAAGLIKPALSPHETLPASAMPMPPVAKPQTTPRHTGPIRRDIELLVLNSGRKMSVPADKETVIIGRSDALTGEAPDVDLLPDNAVELGVSRRHACLTFRNPAVFITDLGSTNRTFLNRSLLLRGQPYAVKEGDEIRLGNAIIRVSRPTTLK